MSQDIEEFKADIESAEFKMGEITGKWQVLALDVDNSSGPLAYINIRAAKRAEAPDYYVFRFKFDGYRVTTPDICLWDYDNNVALPIGSRPIGIGNVAMIFRSNWHGMDHLYAPYERFALATHPDWPGKYGNLCWAPDDNIMKIMNNLYFNLNSDNYHGKG